MKSFYLSVVIVMSFVSFASASGFGVFTQGASGLGQANAVVAHPTGPSSLYFNPALLNDVPGRQIELGTTGIDAERKVSLATGGSESAKNAWGFPSTAYYTHQVNDKFSTGFGLFFPFGLATEWDDSYAGRYLGTYGEITSLNINPVMSYRVSDKLSIAAGFSLLYLDATLKKKINQTAAYIVTDASLGGGILPPLTGPLADIDQRFKGAGWGHGFNFGLLYKGTEKISFGATYRSHIDIKASGKADFSGVNPLLSAAFPETNGQADIRLPAQATLGIAYAPTARFVVEVGARWEDWASTEELRVDLDSPVLGQSSDVVPRDWKATWAYNIGGQFNINETWTLNAGYLYGENAVPSSTFEPLVPDSDAHLLTVGVDWISAPWHISVAFGYEFHQQRNKSNALGDPLGSILAGTPVDTANGEYDSNIYLMGMSLGYQF